MSNLLTLAEELRLFDLRTGIDLALKLRKAKRPRRQISARKGWQTRWQNERGTG